MPLSKEFKEELRKRISKARTTVAPENAVGQWIAGFTAAGIDYNLESIMKKLPNKDFKIKLPKGKKTWHLLSRYRESKQIDHIISDKKGKPVVIVEDKWLKDQRHLKDKGSWIMVLKAVREANPTLRGVIAILSGDWNETTINVLQKLAYVFHIPLKTVYDNLKKVGIEVKIDKKRQAFENPRELLNTILGVVESNLNQDKDILTEVGKKITKKIAGPLEKKIKELLYPEEEETAEKYEFSITTNWGRVKLVEGKCANKKPDDLIEEVKKLVETSSSTKKKT